MALPPEDDLDDAVQRATICAQYGALERELARAEVAAQVPAAAEARAVAEAEPARGCAVAQAAQQKL